MFFFHFYGFFVGLGVLVGCWISEQVRKKLPVTGYRLPAYELLPWALVPGIICARLYHVVDYWQYYSKNLIEIFFLWQGGLGIFGGIMGGMLGLFGYSVIVSWKQLRKKFSIFNFQFSRTSITQLLNYSITNFLRFADLAAFGLPVGQAIGRLGNYFNQELYGLPTNLPWGIYIKSANRLPGFDPPAGGERFHPLFAYEAVWNLAIFIVLTILMRKIICYPSSGSRLRLRSTRTISYRKGTFVFVYLGLYGFGRFWLEFLRIESWRIGEVSVAQGISLGLMGVSLIWLIRQILLPYFYEQKFY